MFWMRTAAAILRDVCAAMFLGMIVTTLVMRMFFIGPLTVLGAWPPRLARHETASRGAATLNQPLRVF